MINRPTPKRAACALLAAAPILAAVLAGRAPAASDGPFADFIEPDFPFITSTVDARPLGAAFSPGNVATRGLVVQLGNGGWALFDPDLLRMAAAWTGDAVSLTTMAQISYQEPGNKNNQIPTILGKPVFTTGIYPGWTAGDPDFRDPRAPGPNPADPGRGPLPAEQARWSGVYTVGDRAVLAYTVGGTELYEQPGSVKVGDQVGIVRTLRTGRIAAPLTLVAAEAPAAERFVVRGNTAIAQQRGSDTVTAVSVVGAPRGARLQVERDRYLTLRLPAGGGSLFRVVVWRGPAAERAAFDRMLRGRTEMADFRRGGPARWAGAEVTRGTRSPDTAAYVTDAIAVPIPNRWRRNVRVADVDFLGDGRAAVVTFEGDVWMVAGIDDGLDELRWSRFASGLYEPMSVQVVNDEVYVYGREGIVRLHDLNDDGEADYYENFTNLVHQSIESREFPLSMDEKPGGGFYVSRGAALDNGPRTSPSIMPGFRAGSRHAGTVVEISADGRSASYFATGLREPFIATHPVTGVVAASDQQGNFVPTTPVYLLKRGGFYGVVPTAYRDPVPVEVDEALAWIPHQVDRSGAGEAWVTGDRMGFGGDALVHVSYGRPGVFRVYADSAAGSRVGGVIPLLRSFTAPALKAQYNPADGHLYLTGFTIWDTNAKGVTAFNRVRYTGRPSPLPLAARAGTQGVVLTFAAPLDPAVADAARFRVQRWNYRRTSAYGSGNFRLDGLPGRDTLRVASAHLSTDRRSLLLVLPEMTEAMQMSVAYDLRPGAERALSDTLHLTLNRAPELDLAAAGFGAVDWRGSIARAAATRPAAPPAVVSARTGAEVFQRIGCAGCHSTDGSTTGRMGPTLRNLLGAQRRFTDGTSLRADDDYVRSSIREPAAKIVAGYAEGMPSYLGVLTDAEIESIVAYIGSLAN